VLSIVNFSRNKKGKWVGIKSYCKDCGNQKRADRLSTEEGRAARSASLRRYRQTLKRQEADHRYIERRAQLQERATPPWVDLSAIAAVYSEAERLTIETGVIHEVHHIHPIMEFSSLFIGLHVPWNLEILPADQHTEVHVELRRWYGEMNSLMKKK
jgi:hypothetical protein